MENILENNIKIALALGFQKTALGWYDVSEVLMNVEEDGNTFDELIFHENERWQRAAICWIESTILYDDLGDEVEEIFEQIDMKWDLEKGYDILLRIIDSYQPEEFMEKDEDGEEKMTAVVVEELTQKHIDCVLRLCDDDADIIQHLGKARKMIDEVLRETLINAIRHMAKNGTSMRIQSEDRYQGNHLQVVAENDNIFVLEVEFNTDLDFDALHTVELQNLYNAGMGRRG